MSIVLKKINHRGMSLLEVLVGMIILSFGILGLAPMIVTSVEGNVLARDNSIASNLAKETIEYYEGLDSLPAMPFKNYEQGIVNGFDRSVVLIDNATDTLLPAGLARLEVQISWTDHQKVSRSTSMSTFILDS